jgi:hypothetical protein
MKNDLELRCLVQALSNMMKAENDEMRQREQYVGYSWDYFGRSYIEATEKATEDFAERLNAYIDARIEAKLKAAQS